MPDDVLPAPPAAHLPPSLPDGHRGARTSSFRRTCRTAQRDIYDALLQRARLRRLSEKTLPGRSLAGTISGWPLLATFRLFEADGPGAEARHRARWPAISFGLTPSAFWRMHARQRRSACGACARSASTNTRITARLMRVNYAALNVEEFGSVYEGLLEYEPVIHRRRARMRVRLRPGGRTRGHRLALHRRTNSSSR